MFYITCFIYYSLSNIRDVPARVRKLSLGSIWLQSSVWTQLKNKSAQSKVSSAKAAFTQTTLKLEQAYYIII